MPHEPFKPGNLIGRTGGRPRGARNRLTLRFLEDVLSIWTDPAGAAARNDLTKGAEALLSLYKDRPADFVKHCFSLASKDVSIESSAVTEMDDEELDRVLTHMHRRMAELQAGVPGPDEATH